MRIGVGDGDRTRDIRSHSPTLYQLSYSHHCGTSSVYAKSAEAESVLRAEQCESFGFMKVPVIATQQACARRDAKLVPLARLS